jgi:hypothetical protein
MTHPIRVHPCSSVANSRLPPLPNAVSLKPQNLGTHRRKPHLRLANNGKNPPFFPKTMINIDKNPPFLPPNPPAVAFDPCPG